MGRGQQMHVLGVPGLGQQPRGTSIDLDSRALPTPSTPCHDQDTSPGFHFLVCRMGRLVATTKPSENQGKRVVNR